MNVGLTCQDSDYARHIQEVLDELGQICPYLSQRQCRHVQNSSVAGLTR